MVAKSAGISTATVYKHFSIKRALFGSIMERIWETGIDPSDSVEQGRDPVAILTAIAYEYAQLLRQPQVEALFRVIIAETPHFSELGEELYYRGKEPYLKRLHTYLEKESELKRFQIDDIPLATRQFLGMINDVIFWTRFLVMNLEISEEDVEHVVTEAVQTFLARYSTSGRTDLPRQPSRDQVDYVLHSRLAAIAAEQGAVSAVAPIQLKLK